MSKWTLTGKFLYNINVILYSYYAFKTFLMTRKNACDIMVSRTEVYKIIYTV